MNGPDNITEHRITEIQRLIDKFQSEFKEGTSDPDHFMSMSDIERLWGELKNNTEKIYSDMVMDLMAEVDEQELISKKTILPGTRNKPHPGPQSKEGDFHSHRKAYLLANGAAAGRSGKQKKVVFQFWRKKHCAFGQLSWYRWPSMQNVH